jgi:hypothetical protein
LTVGFDEVGTEVGYEDGNPVADCAEAIWTKATAATANQNKTDISSNVSLW